SRNSQMEKLWAPQFYGQGKVVIEGFSDKSPLANSGIVPGDEIKKVNDVEIFSSLSLAQVVRNAPNGKVSIIVERDGKELAPINVQAIKDSRKKLGITLEEKNNVFRVESVEAPAKESGMKAGFIVTEIDGVAITDFKIWQKALSEDLRSIKINGYYNDQDNKVVTDYEVTPLSIYGENSWLIGVSLSNKMPLVRQHPTPFSQFTNVINKTAATIKALASRESKVKVRHMSGPLGIVRALGKTVSVGFMYGLEFVVFISFSLALMNLLPLPVLDGGHIMLSTIEMIIRGKMPVSTMRIIETIFVVFLLSFMLYVTFYDVIRVTGIGQVAVEYWKI
ncbi:MAG: site-2 protease family protein, partial [Lentisphaeria bacterium]